MCDAPTCSFTRRTFIAAAASSLSLLGPCVARGAGSGTVRQFQLVARPGRAGLQGLARRPTGIWGYGGGVPGPEIRVRQGDRVRVELTNRLPQETTVHWHGVRVPHAMDGVPHVSQPPVEPGGRFVYEFDVPDAGTFWYHPHVRSSEQVGRGLYGTLIVEERDPPPVDREVVWMLDDWSLARDGELDHAFDDPHDMSHAGQLGNFVTLNGAVPSAFPLRAGERVRLRLVNAANARLFGLEFAGHRPVVIALDGQPVAPHVPPGGRVVLGPAMRVDLLLDATGAPGERYTVRDTFYRRQPYDLLQLAYEAARLRSGTLPEPVALSPNPLAEPDIPGAEVHEIAFQGGMMGRMSRASLDGKPVGMMQMMRSGKAWAVNGIVATGHALEPVLRLTRGRSYVLALRNDTRWHHPIHLHGHSFRVIRRNGRPTEHREWQDTVLMSPDERVDVAFVADNPGDWMLHCHILEHQSGGMMSVVRVE